MVHSVDLEVVHQDFSKAHAWLNLAPTLGDSDLIQVRNEVASHVISEQLDEAQEAVTDLYGRIEVVKLR